jgi:hypothetical protein
MFGWRHGSNNVYNVAIFSCREPVAQVPEVRLKILGMEKLTLRIIRYLHDIKYLDDFELDLE